MARSAQPVLSYRSAENERAFIDSSEELIQLAQVPLGVQFIAPSMMLLACAAGAFACAGGVLSILKDRLLPAIVIVIPLLFALGFLLGLHGMLQYVRMLARAGNKPLLIDIGRALSCAPKMSHFRSIESRPFERACDEEAVFGRADRVDPA